PLALATARPTVPNFVAAYEHRVRVAGGLLLVKDEVPAGTVLRLYEVATGKDVWSQTFAAKTVVLNSRDPDLAGGVEARGRVTVVSLSRRKMVSKTVVDVAGLKNLKEAHLLADDENVYVAFHTTDPTNPNFPIRSNLRSDSGLTGITVNGELYAFNRRTSR